MAQKDPTQVAQKWAQNLGAAGPSITAGVQAVQQAPGAAAARQKAVWAQNVVNSQNKWAQRVAAVTLSEWQDAMLNKGAPRIGQGATAAVPKMTAFMTRLLPYVENARNSLPARGDLNANIARMVAFTQKMAQFPSN